MKTLNFSGSFVTCDLKVSRYRQHVELMNCCELKGQGHFLTLPKIIYKLNVKLNFLSNHVTNQSQNLYVVSLAWRNVYINGQCHMTKKATMAINSKNC